MCLCLLVLRHKASIVLQGSLKMNAPGILWSTPLTCLHNWWETLKGSIFGVNPSIPAIRGPGGGLVVAPAEKTSLKGSRFECKQCREQFVTPLSFSLSLSAILRSSELLSSCVCFLSLTHMGVLMLWVCFLYF